jgi:hypothetical protein
MRRRAAPGTRSCEVNKKLRDLLRRMREEADEAWRNGDPLHAARHRAKRDPALRDEVAELLGPRRARLDAVRKESL